jgi:hypothetical protein
MAKKRVDWVVVRDSGATALCLRCDKTFTVELPCPVSVWAVAMKEFCKIHSSCKAKEK